MLIILIRLSLASIDFSSEQFPFPADEITLLDTNLDLPDTDCVLDVVGDGKCDKVNNKKVCGFDGGDCCRYTCEKNCKGNCPFICGSFGYDCIEDTSCSNCIHGTCNPMSSCYITNQAVLIGVTNCLRNNLVHGNFTTRNFYCGLDPDKSILHSFDSISFHYPGCGLIPEICSVYQCCTDIEENNVTVENCTSDIRNASVYNITTETADYLMISCLDQSQQCFVNNSQISKGECCECEEGWVGRDCDIPTCYPACQNGICTSIDICNCTEGWTGDYCYIPLCTSCINGLCLEPEYCECEYGWSGTECNVPYATPPCLNGIATYPDICSCYTGYTGDRCDIPVCSQCNFGWCVHPNVCECYPPYYTKDISNLWCVDLVCKEIFGSYCSNCTNSTCTECISGYYLNAGVCKSCSEFDINCIKCSPQCDLCIWPYVPSGLICTFPGYLEFSSKYYTVYKSAGKVDLPVYRIGPSTASVNISYTVVPISSSYIGLADFGYFSSTLVFGSGVTSLPITITIYNTFADKTFANTAYIILFNPVGAVIHNATLPSILDYSWSSAGINIISYSILEIWDDPAQAISTNTIYSQTSPASIKTTGSYTFSFSTSNSALSVITTPIFIIQARNITDTSAKVKCVFKTNKFTAPSAVVGSFKATNSSLGYSFTYTNTRGMYALKIFLALPGVYAKIYTNTFFSNVGQEGIRSAIGVYNSFTRPLGNSSSEWSFTYFPSSSIYAYINVVGSSGDSISVSVNEIVQMQCVGSCISAYSNYYLGTGYWFVVKYIHYDTSAPGYALNLQDTTNVYSFTEIYALNDTGKVANLYITDTDEC